MADRFGSVFGIKLWGPELCVVGNSLLRDYLNGTQAFVEVAQSLQMQEAGLRRMVSANATAKNLFCLFKICQKREGINFADEYLSHAA